MSHSNRFSAVAAVVLAVLLAPSLALADRFGKSQGRSWDEDRRERRQARSGYGYGYRVPVYRAPVYRAPIVYRPVYRAPAYGPRVTVNVAPGFGNGRWFHGFHGGRMGWWWGTNTSWYRYDAPVYPAPVVASPVVVPVEPSVAYFCRSAWQYFPQVSDCAEGWESVPR